MNGGSSRVDLLLLWVLLAASALMGLCARLARQLFQVSELPPEDVAQLNHWKLKRRWMIVSEAAALPAFATACVAAGQYWNLPIPLLVLLSMGSGALGFGFLLHLLQGWVTRKVDAL